MALDPVAELTRLKVLPHTDGGNCDADEEDDVDEEYPDDEEEDEEYLDDESAKELGLRSERPKIAGPSSSPKSECLLLPKGDEAEDEG